MIALALKRVTEITIISASTPVTQLVVGWLAWVRVVGKGVTDTAADESVNRTVYRGKGSRIERDPVFAKHQLKTLQGRLPVMDGAPLLRRLADGHE